MRLLNYIFLISGISFAGIQNIFAADEAVPRFVKYDIEQSGCKVYLPSEPEFIEVSFSQDSSKVYTLETNPDYWSGYTFGLIMISLKDIVLNGGEEDMMIAYLDYLKTAFNITESAGYGKGHTISTHPTAKGILDYWIDDEDNDWVVKAWAAESTLTVMYIYGVEPFDNSNIQEMFFNGFRFPEDN